MATFKPVVLKGKGQLNSKGEAKIRILLCHHSKNTYLPTDIYIDPSLMGKNGKVKKEHPNHAFINNKLSSIVLDYDNKLFKFLDRGDSLTVNQLKDYLLKKHVEKPEFFAYAGKRIKELKDLNKKTWVSYSQSIDQFKKYINREVYFDELNKTILEKFEHYLMTKGDKNKKEVNCSINTVAVYMRSIRAIFFDAIDEYNKEGMAPIILTNPFRFYKIKKTATRKRNMSLDVIKAIRDYEPKNIYEEIARDMAMLTFYLIGINTIDLFNLPPISGERIEYYREKVKTRSNTYYSIKVEPEILTLYEKHKGEKYFLKYADNNQEQRTVNGIVLKKHQRLKLQYRGYREFQKMINVNLKDIAKNINEENKIIPDDISTYFMRHSWASIASNDCGISDDDISMCLGHKNQAKEVTMIYINKSQDRVDKANRIVLDKLK